MAGQVRRTVGALVGVAQGLVSLDNIQCMLDEPSHNNWVSIARVAGPEGLYLLEVEYPPDAFCEREGEEGESNRERRSKRRGEEGERKREVLEDMKAEESDRKAEELCGGKKEVEGEDKEVEREGDGKTDAKKAPEENCER